MLVAFDGRPDLRLMMASVRLISVGVPRGHARADRAGGARPMFGKTAESKTGARMLSEVLVSNRTVTSWLAPLVKTGPASRTIDPEA